MDTITKYASIGLGAICTLLIIYCLLLRNDRDNALSKIDGLNGQLNSVISTNLNLQASISILKKQEETMRKYVSNLEKARRDTIDKHSQQVDKFKHVKNSNETYNQAATCKAFSDIVFQVRILKDNGLTLSETTDMLKKFPDDIKKMIKLVYTKNPSLKEISDYSNKTYWDCVEKTKKNIPLL